MYGVSESTGDVRAADTSVEMLATLRKETAAPASPATAGANAATHTATYDYDPQGTDEIALRVGDSLVVTKTFDDGWLSGRNVRTNKSGLFPSTYVQAVKGVPARPSPYGAPR
eukprot:Opistho-1_new@74696